MFIVQTSIDIQFSFTVCHASGEFRHINQKSVIFF